LTKKLPPVDQPSFDAEEYWSRRLERTFSLGGVGWLGMSEGFNRWMYRVRGRAFVRAARTALPEPRAARVLDVGSGTGFYVDLWHALGIGQVTGSDITKVAVDRLRTRRPGNRFVQLNLAAGLGDLEAEEFDAISAMDVLFHIVDDGGYEQALANLSNLLRPQGVLLMSENLVHGPALAGEHQVSRPLEWIEDRLAAVGLDIVARTPMFVLMNTPVDSTSTALHRWWELLTTAVRRWPGAGAAIGAGLYPLELALTTALREGPSTEMVVCRKAATSGSR
jgi:2-polyprenyl-3-methyl-5-hydroxy-6-metoxy-1,4-benzoquinol methylase